MNSQLWKKIQRLFLPLHYALLAFKEKLSKPTLGRTLESHQVTDLQESILDYQKVMSTQVSALYALALDFIHRSVQNEATPNKRVLDLCCGPGHFTRLLSEALGYSSVTGVDLSPGMIKVAKQLGHQDVIFEEGNATRLSKHADQSFDLVTFLNGAHHQDDISDVRKILLEAERVTKPSGLIFLMDPARPKTEKTLEGFVAVAGQDYLRLGMHRFVEDFRETMHASFRPSELRQAVPPESQRQWVLVTQRGLQTYQMLIGLPVNRNDLFLRPSLKASVLKRIVSPDVWLELRLLRFSFFHPQIETVFRPSRNETDASKTL